MTRSIRDIATEIRNDWNNVNYAAKPYLDAMSSLDSVHDSYGVESARTVILYFLSNAGSWRGDTARRVKKELKDMTRR